MFFVILLIPKVAKIKINTHLRHLQSVTLYFITPLIINLEIDYCTKNTWT